ncbi:MAG: sulfatase-like hydrolase/transferase [Planctomycetes bacterium]|nr:sulfatase-like hydrolase/transferase [Planctomycetota bacterium]
MSDQRREYVAMIEHLDGEIGRILDTKEQRDDAKNTIVVLASDHGLSVGSHGLLGKQSLYEHSHRAVLSMRGPGIPAGRRTEALVYLFDVAPTLLRLAGLEPVEGMDGVPLVDVLRGKADSVRDHVFTRFAKGQRAITTERFKLIRYPQVAYSQLFDLKTDPYELTNLAEQPEHRELREHLEARLREAMAHAGDDLAFTAKNPKPLAIDLTGHPRKPDRWQPKWIVEKYFDGSK